MRSLCWVRTDLRLQDNQTLEHFCRDSEYGKFLWSPTPSYLRAGRMRKSFVDACVASFSASLTKNKQTLQISSEQIEVELANQIKLHQIECVYFTREFACEEVDAEHGVRRVCEAHGVKVVAIDQSTLLLEADLPFQLAKLPLVFTEFRKKVEAAFKVRDLSGLPSRYPSRYPLRLPHVASTENFLASTAVTPTAGEAAAQSRLHYYLWGSDRIQTYKETRNGLVDFNDSTKLSFWLNQGCLSARQVHHELLKYEKQKLENESTYWLRFELLWRDYFKFISRKNGSKIFLEQGLQSRPDLAPVNETTKDKATQARYVSWCAGKTADPFVNANMNELNASGFMSNRGRQNVASYLIHTLQVPWTWGASYFEKMLMDYDPDLNWGNWLYLSGRGTDPRARVFNTVLQAQIYDPDQTYQKKWNRS
jgi:deoxyribodipyrimidine photo-lyase